MIFKVSRTSGSSNEKPCEEAVLKKYTKVDERSVDDPKKLSYKNAEKEWYEHGKNHRIENGHIKRDFDTEGWFVHINSLDELLNFKNKYGNLIILNCYENPDYNEIEIYDDYRE